MQTRRFQVGDLKRYQQGDKDCGNCTYYPESGFCIYAWTPDLTTLTLWQNFFHLKQRVLAGTDADCSFFLLASVVEAKYFLQAHGCKSTLISGTDSTSLWTWKD